MRTKISLLIALLISISAISQPPQKFKYQGVARNSNGTVLANQNIALRISLHQGGISGTVIYRESQNITTNQFGVFSINVGEGTIITGSFSSIPWSTNNYFQEVEMDIAGGSSFVSMGTSQLLSVPYALAADSALHGIAPFMVQNNLNDINNLGASVAIIASVSTTGEFGAPALWARNNGTGPSFYADGGTGIYFTVRSTGIQTNGELHANGYCVLGPTDISSLNVIGNVHIGGSLSKLAGSFKIDHPMDPANKYLYHSFVESPDMKNIYDGNITTDSKGDAVVELPSYFDALNKDFRYQLTVIGQFAQAIVNEEVIGNKFKIKTDKPNVKISWQVTGIRKDAYAEMNRIIPEVEKDAVDKGKYLYPEAFNLGKNSKIINR